MPRIKWSFFSQENHIQRELENILIMENQAYKLASVFLFDCKQQAQKNSQSNKQVPLYIHERHVGEDVGNMAGAGWFLFCELALTGRETGPTTGFHSLLYCSWGMTCAKTPALWSLFLVNQMKWRKYQLPTRQECQLSPSGVGWEAGGKTVAIAATGYCWSSDQRTLLSLLSSSPGKGIPALKDHARDR